MWPAIGTLDNLGNKLWFDLLRAQPHCQLLFYLETELIAVGNCAAIQSDYDVDELPHSGWRWVVESGVSLRDSKPRYLSAVSATIHRDFRGRGLSALILQKFKELALELECEAMIAPVRPNRKSEFPLMKMKDYVKWRLDDGRHFDPWLRVHERVGGKLLHISESAMQVQLSIEKWEELLGHPKPCKAEYLIPGALNPVMLGPELEFGSYHEPNVWVLHQLS